MIRRLFTLASLLSLLLCLATAVLWVRNRQLPQYVLQGVLGQYNGSRDVVVLRSEDGFCTVLWITRQPPPSSPPGNEWPVDWGMHRNGARLAADLWKLDRTNGRLARLGFAFVRVTRSDLREDLPDLSRVIVVGCPYWFVVSLAATLPAIEARRQVRRRRRGPDVCKQCGYDLRATRQRCPECGTEA